MHIVDGALSMPVLAAGGVAAIGGVALGLKKMDLDHVPQVGLLSAAFFLASLIHVPIGPSSVHLILNGLVGLVLGWAAFPALLAGLLLQAVFFGFGGLVVLGVNVVNIALPAVLVHYLLRAGLGRALARGVPVFVWGFVAGALAIVLTTGFVALALAMSGDEFFAAAQLVFLAHTPVMVLEGFLTGAAVVMISQVRPEIFALPDRLRQPKLAPKRPARRDGAARPAKQTLTGVLLLLGMWAGIAEAHNIIADVYVVGDKIEGEVGFSSGDPAANAPVTVRDGAGELLGETATDAEGLFYFDITQRVDHHFEVNSGAGHIVHLSVSAQELASAFPADNGSHRNGATPGVGTASRPGSAPVDPTGGAPSAVAPSAVEAAPAAAWGPDVEQLRVMIAETVAQQVKPLRRQLLQYENKVRMRDILGGLGYILGLTGLTMWAASRRRKERPA